MSLDSQEAEDLLGLAPADNAAAALGHARQGRRVFPLHYRPTTDEWTGDRGWRDHATADPAQVAAWWRQHPTARVGMLAGAPNGFTVLDIDRKNGVDGFAILRDLGFPDPESMSPVRVRTPSGGLHLYFAVEPRVKNWAGKTWLKKLGVGRDGLDIRTTGGLVVAPGSYKDSGRYEPLGAPLGSIELPPFPEALIPLIESERPAVEPLGEATPGQREWAADLLAERCADLAATTEGSRENTLNAAALWAGGAAAHGFLDVGPTLAALREAGLACGLPRREVDAKLSTDRKSAWTDGLRKPISEFPAALDTDSMAAELYDMPEKAGVAVGDWHVAAFDAEGEPDLSQDELALALGRAGWNRDARFCSPLGGWLLWRGQRWEPEPGMRPMAIVRGFVRTKARLLVEWAEARAKKLDAEKGEALVRWAKAQAKTLRQDANIAAVERQARSNPKSLALPDQWDSDDFLLGTPGGTVDLRTGELRPAERGDYITMRTTATPAERGERPEAWLRFLGEVFPDDPEMIGFVQRLAGYTLTGSIREHRLFLFHGTGRNGKGTLLGTLQAIMGDYAKGIPTSILLESRSPQHKAPLARLRGARLVRGAELPVGQAWDEGLVKQLSGGDPIPVNHMRGETFDLHPKFTLIVDANTRPRIRTTDTAMRSRMTLVPFTASFAGREDRGLPDRLLAEAPAILRWAIDGAVAWQRDGLGIPDSVVAASREYLDSEDAVGEFLTDEVERVDGQRVARSTLFRRYRDWAFDNGAPPVSLKAFVGALGERGIGVLKTDGIMSFRDVRLRDARCALDDDLL